MYMQNVFCKPGCFGGNKFAISILYIKRYLHWRCFCRNKELTKVTKYHIPWTGCVYWCLLCNVYLMSTRQIIGISFTSCSHIM